MIRPISGGSSAPANRARLERVSLTGPKGWISDAPRTSRDVLAKPNLVRVFMGCPWLGNLLPLRSARVRNAEVGRRGPRPALSPPAYVGERHRVRHPPSASSERQSVHVTRIHE